MTKNVLLLQYVKQTEPSSFINCMSTPWGPFLFFANGRFLYNILQELIFAMSWTWFFLFFNFLNILWIQDVYYVTADISMLSLERNSISSERYYSNSALLSKSSFNSFVSF